MHIYLSYNAILAKKLIEKYINLNIAVYSR